MKNIRKIILAFALIFTLNNNVDAAIKENSDIFTNDIYIIGSTKFDNFTITASRAAIAGANEAYIQYMVYNNYDFDSQDIKTYYYCALDETWSEVKADGSELRELTSEEESKIKNNLNIFFVNNEEKKFEIPFNEAIDENTISGGLKGKATVEGNKIIVPATWIGGFSFESNGTIINVDLSDNELNELEEPVIKKNANVSIKGVNDTYVGDYYEFEIDIKANDFVNTKIESNVYINYNGTSYDIPYTKTEYYVPTDSSWKKINSIYDLTSILGDTLKDTKLKVRIIPQVEGEFKIGLNLSNGVNRYNDEVVFHSSLNPNDVAVINGNYYDDINEAIKEIGEIKLLKNITLSERLNISNDLILDLNEKTINIEGNDARITAKGSSNLTIKNGNIISSAYAVQAQDSATLNIENTLNIISNKYGITIWDDAIVNMHGNITINGDGYGISGNGGEESNTQINVFGNIKAPNGAAIYHPQTGTLNINGGKLTADTVIGVKAGTINVIDGTLTATGDKQTPVKKDNGFYLTGDAIYIEENDKYKDNIIINVYGGTLTSTNGYIIQEFNTTINTENELTSIVNGNYSFKYAIGDNLFVYTNYIGNVVETEDTKFNQENLTITYDGVIKRNLNDKKNKGYIELTFQAPENFDLIDTLVDEESKQWTNNTETIRVNITDKTDKTITIKWNSENIYTYTIKFSDSAKFTYLVNYKNSADSKVLDTELVTEGNLVTKAKTIEVPFRKGYVFENEWGLASVYATKTYDLTTPVVKDINLFTFDREVKSVRYGNEYSGITENGFVGDSEGKQTLEIYHPRYSGKTIKLVAEFQDETDKYDENNYIKVFVNNEWVNFNEGITIKLTEADSTKLKMLVKLKDNTSKLIKFTVYYSEDNSKTSYLNTGKMEEKNIAFSVDGNYYKDNMLSKLLENGSSENPVVLEKDITLSKITIKPTTLSYNGYLNLNGHTITGNISTNNSGLFNINNEYAKKGLNITIYNGNINILNKTTGNVYAIVENIKSSKYATTLNLIDLTITSEGDGIFINGKDSSLYLDNVNIDAKADYAIFGNGANSANSNINIKSSNLKSNKMVIYNPQVGKLIIKKSSLTGLTPIGIKAGELTIKTSVLTSTKETHETPVAEGNGISLTGDAIYAEINSGYGITDGKTSLIINILEKNEFNFANNENAILRIFNPEKIEGYEINSDLKRTVLNENETIYTKN